MRAHNSFQTDREHSLSLPPGLSVKIWVSMLIGLKGENTTFNILPYVLNMGLTHALWYSVKNHKIILVAREH